MRNQDRWAPSKYVYRKRQLVSSKDPRHVGLGSRLVANLTAEVYHDNLANHARGHLLDLGCGKVPLYMAYKDHVAENVCVDWKQTLHKSDHLDFELDLTQPLPFAARQFDTILLSDVLEHIPEPDRLWTEMARLLSAGGKIVLNVPFCYPLHEHPHDYYRYTEFALRRFAENVGLAVVQLDAVGGAPEVIVDIFSKCVLRVPILGRWVATGAQWMAWSFRGSKFVRRVSDATKKDFPLAYFMVAQRSA